MSYETLLYEVSEHVATITFNRPEENEYVELAGRL